MENRMPITSTRNNPPAEVNGWEAILSAVLGCLMMLPILMDLFHPLSIPFGWLYLLPVCLYSLTSTSHSRIWTLLTACSAMLVAETLLFMALHEPFSTLSVIISQLAAGMLIIAAGFYTHCRLWALEEKKLRDTVRLKQDELDRANALFAVAGESYGLGGFLFQPELSRLLLGDATLELLGKTSEFEFTLRDFTALMLPGYGEEVHAALDACLHDGSTIKLQCQLLTRGSERVWLELNANPYFSGNRISAVIGTLRNISVEKAQQKDYSEEIARLHESLHSLPGVLWQYSSTSGLSASCEDEDGCLEGPDARVLRRRPMALIHPDDRFGVLRQWLRAQQSNGSHFVCRARLFCRDHQYRHYQLQAKRNLYGRTPLLAGEWNGIGVEVNVPSGYAVIAQTAATGADRKLVHDLNNVLTSILGSAENIELDSEVGAAVRLEARQIIDSVGKASGLLQDDELLGTASCQAPQQPLAITDNYDTVLKSSESTVTKAAGRKTTILLVEDDDLVSRYTQKILRNAGYQVLVACNGSEALEILRSQSQFINIMVTDMFMPGAILGSELVARAREEFPHIHTILASGYDTAVVNFFNNPEVNATEILRKPFKASTLLGRIAKIESKDQYKDDSDAENTPKRQHLATALDSRNKTAAS